MEHAHNLSAEEVQVPGTCWAASLVYRVCSRPGRHPAILTFQKMYFYCFVCMGVLPACMSVYNVGAGIQTHDLHGCSYCS